MAGKNFQNPIGDPTHTRFFLDKRYPEFCIWVQKTYNRKGYTAEIFRVDDRGRKCCILVPEGTEKSGWKAFQIMLNIEKEMTNVKRNLQPHANKLIGNSSTWSSSDSDSLRRTYVDVLQQRSPTKSDSSWTTKQAGKKKVQNKQTEEKESPIDWNNSIVLTRRCLHDDWHKIAQKISKQMDVDLTYKPFHAEKALLVLKDEDQASLLCQNKDWCTVEKYYVKFEKWNQKAHAAPKLLSSYEGWMRFRGIPLHAWNFNTFKQISDACGGFLAVSKETREKIDIIETNIKIRLNYTGFVSAIINIIDEDGNRFLIQTVVHAEARWLIERNPCIHGTFSTQAADSFDEFDPSAEQYVFIRNVAVSPNRIDIEKCPLDSTRKGQRKINSPENSNWAEKLGRKYDYDGDGDSNSYQRKKSKERQKKILALEKEKGKMIATEEKRPLFSNTKKKVTFPSPKTKFGFLTQVNQSDRCKLTVLRMNQKYGLDLFYKGKKSPKWYIEQKEK
uniref:DUF4283 domain-containing protein n=1 Tax=Cucumis melo TaxID=3656 RepID=A0A9I9D6L4_CUCME